MESAEILFSEREKPRIIGRCHILPVSCSQEMQTISPASASASDFYVLQVGLACLAAVCIPTAALW